jgi:hypothetical protein
MSVYGISTGKAGIFMTSEHYLEVAVIGMTQSQM